MVWSLQNRMNIEHGFPRTVTMYVVNNEWQCLQICTIWSKSYRGFVTMETGI